MAQGRKGHAIEHKKKRKHLEIKYENKNPKRAKKDLSAPDNKESQTENTPEKKTSRTNQSTKSGPPANWREAWDIIMANTSAARPPRQLNSPDERFRKLFQYMLSGQTRDATVDQTMERILKRHPKLSAKEVSEMTEDYVAELIQGVTSYARKAKWLKNTAEVLVKKCNGDIPNSYEELIKLNGVGPKIATMVMRYCWGSNVGIAVDVHVHRVANRLGWVNEESREGTKAALESWIPEKDWTDVGRLYKFGQEVCTSFNPQCRTCPLKHLCPSSTV